MHILKEACTETYDGSLAAQTAGAQRIELCGDLSVGGITPDFALAEKLLQDLDIPLKVMVRPRGGNFVYSDAEFAQMLDEIERFKSMGVKEVVFGFLNADHTIDREKTALAAAAAQPMRVTFHKAIDETPHIQAAVRVLKDISGVTSILSSGGRATAMEGKEILARMKTAAGESLTVIAAGKITPRVLPELTAYLGAGEYHGRAIV